MVKEKISDEIDSNDYVSEEYLSPLGWKSHQFAIRASEWALSNGSPEPGWERAHTPLPRDLGDGWVWLPHDLHQIHGLLQSEDMGRCCFFYPHTLKFLQSEIGNYWFELWDIFEKWSLDQKQKAGESKKYDKEYKKQQAEHQQRRWKDLTPEQRTLEAKKITESMTSEQISERNRKVNRRKLERRKLRFMSKNDPLIPDFDN